MLTRQIVMPIIYTYFHIKYFVLFVLSVFVFGKYSIKRVHIINFLKYAYFRAVNALDGMKG